MFIGFSIFGLIFAIPIAITIQEVRGRKWRWVCPKCGQDASKNHCGQCGAAMRAKPSYAGFRKRLAAMTMDTLILLIPETLKWLLLMRLEGSRLEYFLFRFLGSALGLLYILWFTSQFGQTPGKYLAGIRIVTLKLKMIRPVEAFKREAVTIVLSVLSAGVMAVALLNIPAEKFAGMADGEKTNAVMSFGRYVLVGLSITWQLGELIFLLTNKKKRALHDFIAGTVVVDEKTLKRKIPKKYQFRWWGTGEKG